MVNLKSLIAGAGLSLLASGALALTPVNGEVLTPAGAPKSAPTWMEFQPESGSDTLYGACTSFLAAAGLADKYGWTDCAGVVVQQNGQEKFLPGFKLRQDTTYLLPVAVDPTTGQVQSSAAAAAAPAVSGAQMAADIATLREIVDGNLPAMAEAIRGNTARINEQSARVDDHARSLDELASWAESNTQAVEENRQLIGQNATAAAEAKSLAEQASADATAAQTTAADAKADATAARVAASEAVTQVTDLTGRFDGLAGQVTKNAAAAERSNWALLAAAGAALAALLAIVIAMLRHRKLPGRVARVEEKQAETHAELFPVSFDETKVSVEELQKLVVGNDSLFIPLPVTRNETGEVHELRIERIADNLFRIHGVSRGAGQPSYVDCSGQKVIKTIRKAGRDERLTNATPAIRSAAA